MIGLQFLRLLYRCKHLTPLAEWYILSTNVDGQVRNSGKFGHPSSCEISALIDSLGLIRQVKICH